jgi:alkaline phosphatase D
MLEPTAGAGGGTEGGAASNPSEPGGAAGDSPGAGGTPVETIVKASDDFTQSAEGWTISSTKPERPATFSPTGGHRGGMISAVDDADETWFFAAPAKYLGDVSNLYGGMLRFDLKVTELTNPFSYTDVQLASGSLSLVYDCSPDPSTLWTSYEVPLTEAGWKVDHITSGAPATKEQFQQVLANLTTLRIRGEYNGGEDTGMLDNVYLGSD